MSKMGKWLSFVFALACLCSGVASVDAAPPAPERAIVERVVALARSARTLPQVTRLFEEYQRLDVGNRYAELDALQAALRGPALNHPDMQGLEFFYSSLERRTDPMSKPAAIELRKRWLQARPASVAARVLLAAAYLDWGHEARGSGYADTVTAEGWRLLRERVAVAAGYLREAAASPQADAQVFTTILRLSRYQESSRSAVDATFARAIALDRQYTPAWRQMTLYLLPRWFGRPGDLADLVRRSVGLSGDHIACASVAVWVYRYEKTTTFTTHGLPWPLIKLGFEEKLKRYPQGPVYVETANYFAALACLAGDRATARAAFARLGAAADADYFKPGGRSLDECRAWASK